MGYSVLSRLKAAFNLLQKYGTALVLVCFVAYWAYNFLSQGSGVYGQTENFHATTLSGRRVVLTDYTGKVVVLNYWFTSCAPCRLEMPALSDLEKDFEDKPVVFLALNVQDSPEFIRDFLANHRFTYTHTIDISNTFGRFTQNHSVPLNVVIGPTGTIVFKREGYSPLIATELSSVINRQLAALR